MNLDLYRHVTFRKHLEKKQELIKLNTITTKDNHNNIAHLLDYAHIDTYSRLSLRRMRITQEGLRLNKLHYKFSLRSRILKKLRHEKQTQAPTWSTRSCAHSLKRPEGEGTLINTEITETQE